MNCREFEIEWVEQDGGSRLSDAMEQHRRECRRCSAMSEDLNAIIAAARASRIESEPPQRVWASLRNQLEIEGLVREPAPADARPGRAPSPAFGWGWLRVPMGLAYAAVFFVALSVMYTYNEATDPGVQPPIAGTPAVPDIARARPSTSVEDQKVTELLARMPDEQQRATFVSNWQQVNTSIESLQTFVEANPADPFAAEMLKNSLQQKEYLRATLAGWEGN
jgi:hypothetical protein